MKYDLNFLTQIFDEWAKRYSENPEDHIGILNKDGEPTKGIGRDQAECFLRISNELSKETK